MRRLRASPISVVSHTSSASLPAAMSARRRTASWAIVTGSPRCSRPWVRYQSMARRPGPGRRRAAPATPSAFVGVAHPPHLERCCAQGRSAQSWANMPPRALHGGQLVGVADQHRLDPGGGGGGQQFAQLVGADHGGLIHDDEGVRLQPQPAFAQSL